MEMWSLCLFVEDKYKNLFAEHVETLDGYISSSLFANEDLSPQRRSRNIFISNINSYLGEFHSNEYWQLEVLLNKKPSYDEIVKNINNLSRALGIREYEKKNNVSHEKDNGNFIQINKVQIKDWLKENRKSFPTIKVDNFYIYGSHIKKDSLNNVLDIKIDASTAFGTGSHATTKCCLKAISFLSKSYKPYKVLDYGCGTGILGIASRKKFKKNQITLVDIDLEAIRISKDNIKLNNILSKRLYPTNKFFSHKYVKKNYYDLVFANILFSPLYNLASLFKKILNKKSYLILSGLLDYQVPRMIKRYNNFGFVEEKRIILSGWGAVIMKMKR